MTDSKRATYSPEDNKLRLYIDRRLTPEEYARFKKLGFRYATKQQLFVAPMWTPSRFDLLLDFCGSVGDEDQSLAERSEQRAKRFGEYSEKRLADAHRAKDAVDEITGGIPTGQPILVGHHSEKRARKDAEKIENGMKKAVNMWETSKYWTYRAEGALADAKYKERADVRARRIKKLGAEMRKHERNNKDYDMWLKLWGSENLTLEKAYKISCVCRLELARKEGDDPRITHRPSAYTIMCQLYKGEESSNFVPRTFQEVIDAALRVYPKSIAWQNSRRSATITRPFY